MRKFYYLFFLAGLTLLLGVGCNNLDEVNEKLQDHENRLAKLEKAVSDLNSQVGVIQTLLSGKYFVQGVATLEDGSGYRLTLLDDKGNVVERTVLNGKDGKDGTDGKDGHTPQIGVKLFSDGNYYWTVDGEWLLVNGEKVRANGIDGQDGPSPQFKIEDGNWFVKVGDGEWTLVGAATPEYEPIDPVITDVDTQSSEDSVIFTLADGTTISVPKASSMIKLHIVVDETALETATPGSSVSAPYEVFAPNGVTFTIDTYEPQGWEVSVIPTGATKGNIKITIPADATSSKILVVLEGSDGSNYTKVLRLGLDYASQTIIDAAGGSFSLGSVTNVKVEDGASWITVSGNMVTVSQNDTYDSRTAIITYEDADGNVHTMTVIQAQKDAIILSANSIEADPEGEETTFVLSANVDVQAKASVSWIQIAPVTKGLENKYFNLTVEENGTGADRSGTILFSCGDLSQTVTVTQAKKGSSTTTNTGFELVTDTSDLEDGDRIILVSLTDDYAMGTASSNGTYRYAITVSSAEGFPEEIPQNVIPVTIGITGDKWTMEDGTGYLASQSNSANQLVTVKEVTDYAKWSIAVAADGTATIKASAGARSLLGFNTSSAAHRFNCYEKTSSSVSLVKIYKEKSAPINIEEDPIREKTEYGCYLGGAERIYMKGFDQYLRDYSDSQVTFVILQKTDDEQLEVSGYDTNLSPGDKVKLSINWRKGLSTILDKSATMYVVKEEGSKVWLGNGKGEGFIIRK